MSFVVTEACQDCKHAQCVEVCPADCFREGSRMLYIDPDSCTECSACESACPEEAIFHQDNLPEDLQRWIQINADQASVCPERLPA